MSLFEEPPTSPGFAPGRDDDATLHRMGCRACPLAHVSANLHPYMDATGAKNPLVYLLGEAPGKTEDEQGRQFVGDSGKVLRPLVPDVYARRVRWNNSINCRPPKNRNPSHVEVECCRSRVVADIEASKPRAIFGFGNVPLEWTTGQSGITLWRGRRLPVRVGTHACWYFPMLHPAYLVRNRRGGKPSADERIFELDVERAFAAVETLPEPRVHTAADVRAGCEIVSEGGAEGLRQIRDLLAWAAEQPVIGVDYETSSLRPYRRDARILTAAVGTGERAAAFPLEHPDAPWSRWELDRIVEAWQDFLRAPRVVRAVHNLAFELEWTGKVFGSEYVRAGLWADTATQAAILDERHRKMREGPFSLDWLVLQHFGFRLKSLFPELDRAKLAEYPVETVLHYNAPDAKYHALLCEAQARLIREQGLDEPFRLANRRVPTVVLSQMLGIPVDQGEVRSLQKKYADRLSETQEDIGKLPVVRKFHEETGGAFNPLSNPNVHHVFVEMLHRPECRVTDKYTGKEKLSADEAILSKIDHPLSELVLDFRHYNKRLSTYVDPLLEGSPIFYDDGLLHTNYNTFFAATGRLSSDGPNMQNFPKRDGEAVEVRRPIAAPPGCVILALDYGQIEARVIAMLSGDERFIRALWDRYDVHMEWAERIARACPRRIGGKKMLEGFRLIKDPKNKDREEVKAVKDFRTDIKNQWTFPLFFGAKRSSAAGYLKVPEDAIEDEYDAFWEEFAGIEDWQDDQQDFYREHGYVECATGRRRCCSTEKKKFGALSLNEIINTPVQGTAAEIVLDAMCRLSETGDPELQPELNIHDDLSFLRVPEDRVDDVAEKVLDHMLDVPFEWAKTVPITVEMACGRNWMPYDRVSNPEGLKEVGTYSSDEWFD